MAIDMKTYLPTLLLFFLLVDPSVSPPIPLRNIISNPFVKGFVRQLQKEAGKTVGQNLVDKFKNHNVPPPPPGAPPEIIPGLHLVKEYLSNYGYIQYSDNFTDALDEVTRSALKSYQNFFNLTETGYLDNETLQQISFLRCAVPDMNFTYNLSASNNMSWPLGTKWFPNGTNLTYGFLAASKIPPNATKVFRDSFKRWSDAIGVLNLTETTYNDAANIKIGFYNFSDIMDVEVVGGTLIELIPGNNSHADVTFGDMLLDATKYWALPNASITSSSWQQGIVDLSTVAMHQIGHLLGLSHSSHNDSVMYPYILPSNQRKVQLSNDDQQQIKQVYFPSASGGGRVTLVGSRWGLLATFSLGFACMVLSY